MNIQILANLLKFIERAPVTGAESYAWIEAHQFLQGEINKLAQETLNRSSGE